MFFGIGRHVVYILYTRCLPEQSNSFTSTYFEVSGSRQMMVAENVSLFRRCLLPLVFAYLSGPRTDLSLLRSTRYQVITMEILPNLTFCEVLCAYVCLDRRCRVVVQLQNVKQHLIRKHSMLTAVAVEKAQMLLQAVEGRTAHEIASRYFENPIPKIGECPLPVLPLLPVYDITRCPCWALYFKGIKSCKSHLRSMHSTHSHYKELVQRVSEQPTTKGQALFLGNARLFFPVNLRQTNEDIFSNAPPILHSAESQGRTNGRSDEVSLREKSANLTCSILGIPEFVDAQQLTLQRAYDLSRVDRDVHTKLVGVFLDYVKHFANMQPPVPTPIIEGIKIRNAGKVANFSLSIERRSKERYAAVAARILHMVVKIGSNPLPRFNLDDELLSFGRQILETILGGVSTSLHIVHRFLRVLLLQSVRASIGEVLMLEDLFKLLIAGYTCGIRTKRVRVGDADDASHTAAAMQYFAHIAALGEFFIAPIGFGVHREEEEPERLRRIQEFLSTETCSPAAYLRTVLLKTKSLSAGESPSIDFVPCPHHELCGTVDNLEVQLNSENSGSLGFTVRSIQRDTFKMLREELMRGFDIPSNFTEVVLSFPDSLNEKESGYYFGEGMEAKKQFQIWSEGFARHLSEATRPILGRRDSGETWGPTNDASHWLRTVDTYSTHLYVLVHLCGGGPPRVTEMVEAKLKNTAASKRNVFIVKQRLAIIGSYSKTSKQLQKPKPIARFLDSLTTELLLLFIVFVKPVQCFLLKQSSLDLEATEDYLFCQGGLKVSDNAICKAFSKALTSRGLPLTVSLYRQYRTGVAKAYLSDDKSMKDDQLIFLQAGHTEATARVRYAGGDFNVGELSLAKLEGFYRISMQWHKLIGVDGTHKALMVHEKGTENSTNLKSGAPSVFGNLPSNEVNNVGPVTPSSRENQKRANMQNQASSRLKRAKLVQGSPTISARSKPNPKPILDSVVTCAKDLLRIPQHTPIRFKSEAQRAALMECGLQTLIEGYVSSMVIILPTGGGKTLTWAAAVLHEQRNFNILGNGPPVTLLILPLISLQQDMLRKCREYRIRVALWEERYKAGVTVVICSIDIVFTRDYERFVTALSAQKRIARIVLDEAHLVLLWKTLRRFAILGSRLRPSQARHVPLVCLSATLSNEMVSRLQQVLQLNRCCVKLYRATNSRHNISYQVRTVKYDDIENMVMQCSRILSAEVGTMRREERVIAFCLTVKDCIALHNKFKELYPEKQVCLFHGSMSLQEKRESFATWMQRESEHAIAMIATSAFSCGIDYPHVRTVLHVGGSRSLVEIAQESGRAGRDGEPSKNLILYNARFFHRRIIDMENVNAGIKEKELFGDVKKLLENNGRCRREALESFLNDQNRGPCTGVEIRCDVCLMAEAAEMYQSQVSLITSSEEQRFSNERGGCVLSGKRLGALPVLDHRLAGYPSLEYQKTAFQSTRTVWHEKKSAVEAMSSDKGYYPGSNDFDRDGAIWQVKQLALTRCVICIFKGRKISREENHSGCMRGICFRCMERNAAHQSKECNVTPRASKTCKRCFFCGISRSKELHDNRTFNRRGECEWEAAKNLALLMWTDVRYRHELLKRIPKLLYCKSMVEVGEVLSGGEGNDCEVMLLHVVGYMHSEFVLGVN